MLAEALAAFEAEPEASRKRREAEAERQKRAAAGQGVLPGGMRNLSIDIDPLRGVQEGLASACRRRPDARKGWGRGGAREGNRAAGVVGWRQRRAAAHEEEVADPEAASAVVATGGAATATTHGAPPPDGLDPDDGDDASSDGGQSVQSGSLSSFSVSTSAAAHALAGTLGSSSSRARAGRLACRRPAGSPRPPGTAPKLPDLGDDLLLLAAELAEPRPPRRLPSPRPVPTPTGTSGPAAGGRQVEFAL